MPFIDVNGVRTHYRFDGPAGAPVLVLSNSLGTDLAMWEPQLPAFAERLRVLRYDTRGHGASQTTPGPYTIEQLGRDVVGLLDALEIERAHFCGLSMGGAIGLWLAIYAHGRLGRTALCNTAAHIGSAETWNARIDAVRRGGMAAVVETVLARWFTEPFRHEAPEKVERVGQMLLRAPAEGYVSCCAAVRDMDLRNAVSRAQARVLVLAGTHDAVTPPADGRLLADNMPGARYAELDAAHLSNVEAAQPFTATVLRFMTAGEPLERGAGPSDRRGAD